MEGESALPSRREEQDAEVQKMWEKYYTIYKKYNLSDESIGKYALGWSLCQYIPILVRKEGGEAAKQEGVMEDLDILSIFMDRINDIAEGNHGQQRFKCPQHLIDREREEK
jgi:hypothetical protein